MPRVFSGIKPTNIIHIGNYFGAIKNWLTMQKDNECFFCIVDLHALTVATKPDELNKQIISLAKTYLACGIDPKKSVIYQQSSLHEHAELCWLLNTIAKVPELERMTQFKDKAKEQKTNINMGLFDYPVLMAADILLYDTQMVPVGEDQMQHIELARTLAERFNHMYGDTFVVPEGRLTKIGARLMGLDDPAKKMSKTAPTTANYIGLLDDPAVAAKKVMRAVTDSGTEIKSGADKPALTNLLAIYSLLSGKEVKAIEKRYIGKGYADFKKDLAALVSDFLIDFQKKYNAISDREVKTVLSAGHEKAETIAKKKMALVKKKMGLTI